MVLESVMYGKGKCRPLMEPDDKDHTNSSGETSTGNLNLPLSDSNMAMRTYTSSWRIGGC